MGFPTEEGILDRSHIGTFVRGANRSATELLSEVFDKGIKKNDFLG